MKTSDVGRKLIEDFEGCILSAYDDANDKIVRPGNRPRGVLTIGYGHTNPAGPPRVYVGMTIDKMTADKILAADLASVELEVDHLITATLSQRQFDALVSFHFNTGALGKRTCSVRKFMNAGNPEAAGKSLLLYNKAGGRTLQGLVRRRKAELKLFTTGVYP